jgi:hypothetical protein
MAISIYQREVVGELVEEGSEEARKKTDIIAETRKGGKERRNSEAMKP